MAKGALEGAAKGVLEGAADHLEGAHAGEVVAGANTGIIAALKLRSAPATVVMSGLLLFSWIFTMLGMKAVQALLPAEGLVFGLAKVGLLVGAPVLALFPTSLVVRPLARVFTPMKATTHGALVGKMCTIRTGTVTDRFGEATLEDGGAGVVVRVRVESGEKLGRGDQAVIVGYDAARQEFTVAPLEDLLDEETSPAERAMSAGASMHPGPDAWFAGVVCLAAHRSTRVPKRPSNFSAGRWYDIWIRVRHALRQHCLRSLAVDRRCQQPRRVRAG